MRVKIDLHVHTRFSDSQATPLEVIRAAIDRGLQGVAITDHNTISGVNAVRSSVPRNFLLIPGVEVSTLQGDLLGLGVNTLPPIHKDATVVAEYIRSLGGIVVIPHPSLPLMNSVPLRMVERIRPDAIEVVSAFTPFGSFFGRRNVRLASKLGIPQVASSDSHFAETVGDAYTVLDLKERSTSCALQAIKDGGAEFHWSPSPLKYKVQMMGRTIAYLATHLGY